MRRLITVLSSIKTTSSLIVSTPTRSGEFYARFVPSKRMPTPAADGLLPAGYSNITPNYTTTFPEAGLTFIQPYQQIYNPGIALGAINPNIKQPYTQSWNLSIQRPIGRNNAIEIRYIGSRSVHQWLNLFTDEVNIFENGFLTQFQQAQKNLAVNAANGYTGVGAAPPQTFANLGFAGEAGNAHIRQRVRGIFLRTNQCERLRESLIHDLAAERICRSSSDCACWRTRRKSNILLQPRDSRFCSLHKPERWLHGSRRTVSDQLLPDEPPRGA